MGFFKNFFNFNKNINGCKIEHSNKNNLINNYENYKFELVYNLEGFPKQYDKLVCSKNGLYFATLKEHYSDKSQITLYKCNLQLKECKIIFEEKIDINRFYYEFYLNNDYLVYSVGNEVKILNIHTMELKSINSYKKLKNIKISNVKNIISINYSNDEKSNSYLPHDSCIDIYNLNGLTLLKTLKQENTTSDSDMYFSYNDDYFIHTLGTKTYVYNMKTFKCVNIINDFYTSFGPIVLGNNSNIMAGIKEDEEGFVLYLYNLDNSKFIKLNDKCPEDKSINVNKDINRPMYFSPNDDYLIFHGFYNEKWTMGGIDLYKNIMVYNIKSEELIFNNLYEDKIVWSILDNNNDFIVILNSGEILLYNINGNRISNIIKKELLEIYHSDVYKYINDNMIISKDISINKININGIINLSRKFIEDLEIISEGLESISKVNDSNYYTQDYWTERDMNEHFTGDCDIYEWD